MADVTVREFADVLHVPVQRLVDQLRSAGIGVSTVDDYITDDMKRSLLAHLRQLHGQDEGDRDAQSLASPETGYAGHYGGVFEVEGLTYPGETDPEPEYKNVRENPDRPLGRGK